MVVESKLQTEVTEEMFAEGFKIATERSDEHETLDMEVKTLKSGTSTILVAALSPEVEGDISSSH